MWEVITSELHLSQIESFTPFLHSFAHTLHLDARNCIDPGKSAFQPQRLTWIKELKKPDYITFISN